MNLFDECLRFSCREKDNGEEISGYYNFGALHTTGWKVVLKITAYEDHDLTVYPLMIINQFDNGEPTDVPEVMLELNRNFDYGFVSLKSENEKMFAHLQDKMSDTEPLEDLDMILCVDGTQGSYEWLAWYAKARGYDMDEIEDELRERFAISLD